MKRFHIALSVADLNASIDDYSARLGQPPEAVVDGVYARWRTELVNFSITQDPARAGSVSRLGFLDDNHRGIERDTDVNGIAWENLSPLVHDLHAASAFGVPRHAAADDELIRN